jgi:hypothetical protein
MDLIVLVFIMCLYLVLSLSSESRWRPELIGERLVLPPGYGRVVGVEFGERLPVGSDVLFCFFIC